MMRLVEHGHSEDLGKETEFRHSLVAQRITNNTSRWAIVNNCQMMMTRWNPLGRPPERKCFKTERERESLGASFIVEGIGLEILDDLITNKKHTQSVVQEWI